jgi:hypothetical protein
MPSFRAALCALACAAWLCAASNARSGDPPKVLLVQAANGESQMARRLHAEFMNLGIAVVEIPDESGDDVARFLSEAALRERAFAAIRVTSDAGGTTVWVADRLTDKILVRALPASRADVGDEVVALEVVELLRASLLELNLPEPSRKPSPPEVAALIGPVDAPPPAGPSRLHAVLAPTVLGGPGGVGPTGHATVGLRYQWSPMLSSRAFVVLPVVPGTVRGPEGHAEVDVAMTGAALDVALTPSSSDWLVSTGAALNVAWIRTVGTTESALLERTDSVFAVVPALVLALHRHLSTRASLGIEALSGVSVPRPVIVFGDRSVAHWGRPLLGASLALELALD